MGLEAYREKRDFGRTPEPAGDGSRSDRGEPRAALSFVVQKHDASHLHYDFRLEHDGVLLSWAVPKGPVPDPGVKRLAMRTEDHPLDYGGFEGVIPQAEYGGGTVMLWDRGTWTPEGDPAKGLKKGTLDFRLDGQKLRGRWTLIRTGSDGGKQKWLLFKRTDEHARRGSEDALLDERPLSVASGRSLGEIADDRNRVWSSTEKAGGAQAKTAPRTLDVSDLAGARKMARPPTGKPQLATLVDEAPKGDDWLHEIKYDGYRLLLEIRDGQVRLITRNGKEWTERFPRIASAASALATADALLDGEAVLLDEGGRSDFQALQNALDDPNQTRMFFYAFDVLWLQALDVRASPLVQRKELLRQLLEDAPAVIRYSDHVVGGGPKFHAQACEHGLEGIISKRADGRYRAGRSKSWLKIKCIQRQEFVVIGWTEPEGSRTGLGSLVLGVHDDERRLRYAGRVGTGFDTATLEDLADRLQPMERKTPPARGTPKSARGRTIHWVRPEMVVEVAFTEWTSDGAVRHPSFQGVREDREAEEVIVERQASGVARRTSEESDRPPRGGTTTEIAADGSIRVAGVRVSSPDKVLWPEQGVSKRELAEYWAAVSEHALPYIAERPLTLLRCPSGVEQNCFFQKHAGQGTPDILPRVDVKEKDDREPYMYADGPEALIALVQLGVLELHVWNSRVDRLERPDTIVMDVDPGPNVPWDEVRAAAIVLRDLLAELGLESWPRATGGKGLHVVVPLVRRNSWDDVRAVSERLSRMMAEAAPGRFLAKASRKARTGRIYIDYLRNVRNATAIGTLSPRAREGAPVALPLSWKDLEQRDERPVLTVREVDEVLAHMRRDPWAGYGEARQSLTKKVMERLEI